jgi:Zn-dependent protease
MMMFSMATGYGIGWGKPAPINPDRMRNPRWDLFAAVAAGPVSNLLQACIYGFLGRLLIQTDQITLGTIEGAMRGRSDDLIAAIVGYGVSLNLSLAFFNLIPIAPLDGHWLVGQLLSGTTRDKWYLYSRRYGPIALMTIIIGGQLVGISVVYMVIRPAIEPLERILLGK